MPYIDPVWLRTPQDDEDPWLRYLQATADLRPSYPMAPEEYGYNATAVRTKGFRPAAPAETQQPYLQATADLRPSYPMAPEEYGYNARAVRTKGFRPADRIRNPLPEMLPRFAEFQQGVGDALQREANWQRIGEAQAQRIRNPLPEMLPRFAEFQQGLGEAMSQEDADLLQWAKSMRRQMVPR